MYSPKIKEALIPQIYRSAKAERIPMTQWVNRALEKALSELSAGSEDNHNDQNLIEESLAIRRKERRSNGSSGPVRD
jgi:hypothetical protein